MVKRTHMAGGLLTAAIMLNGNTDIAFNVLGAGLAIFGGLLPDIDTPTSALGKKIPGRKRTVKGKNGKKRVVKVDNIVSRVFKHRTFTHSVLFTVIVWNIINFIVIKGLEYNIDLSVLQFITYGIISHILLDLLNYQGIPLLYPLDDKFTIPIIRIKTGSGGDMMAGLLCVLVAIIFYVNPNLWSATVAPYFQGLWAGIITALSQT